MLSDTHEKYIDTSSARIPQIRTLKSPTGSFVRVACLFTRSAAAEGVKSCCVAYALKELKGFSMPMEDKIKLFRRAIDVGRRIDGFSDVDRLLPLPSSHDLVERTCRVLSARLPNHPGTSHIFRRLTIGEVLGCLPPVSRVPEALRSGYLSEVERLKCLPSESTVSLKTIPTRLRRFFKVLDIANFHDLPRSKHVLLVDDVLSSGVTFSNRRRSPRLLLPTSQH